MKIRKMRTSDSEAIIHISKSLPKWFTSKGVRQIKRASKKQNGFIALKKNKTIGFILYRKRRATAEITWMGILPIHRNKGVGRKLVKIVENQLKKEKIKQLKVSTLAPTVKYKPYDETRKFYYKMGFKKHRIDKNFYRSGKHKDDRLVLVKPM